MNFQELKDWIKVNLEVNNSCLVNQVNSTPHAMLIVNDPAELVVTKFSRPTDSQTLGFLNQIRLNHWFTMEDLKRGKLLEQFYTKLTGINLDRCIKLKSIRVGDLEDYTNTFYSSLEHFNNATSNDIFIKFTFCNMITNHEYTHHCFLPANEPNNIVSFLK
jgi:hypothetical protein